MMRSRRFRLRNRTARSAQAPPVAVAIQIAEAVTPAEEEAIPVAEA